MLNVKGTFTPENFDKARRNLSQWLLQKADILSRIHGVGYIDSDEAPNDFEALKEMWKECRNKGKVFHVWNGESDNIVYTSKGANYAFRFWHDILHVQHNLGFSLADEISVGMKQTFEIQEAFGNDSIEAMIMLADTVGQSLYASYNKGNFPVDQLGFVYTALEKHAK